MKRPLKTRRLVPVALILTLVLVCGTVFAYMFMRTGSESTKFIPAQVSCTVSESFDGTQKSDITVKNTGNIPAYLRVRLVTYWVDAEGNVAAKSSPDLEIAADDLGTGWIEGKDNTFYYTKSVAPGAATLTALVSGNITLAIEDDYRQVIDVFAEAIQADPTTAATSSWGVTITDKEITSVPKT